MPGSGIIVDVAANRTGRSSEQSGHGDRTAILTNSGWRHNFTHGHPVPATIGGKTTNMVGHLEAEPKTVARVYSEKIKKLGNTNASRRLGVKIEGEGEPTLEQLTDLARQEGLSVIFLDPANRG